MSVSYLTAVLLTISIVLPSGPLSARDKNLPIPRFAAIRPDRANIRVGPGAGYPVEWVVVKSGVPVEITAEFDNWCRLNFPDGSQGWVHRNMLPFLMLPNAMTRKTVYAAQHTKP